MLCYNGTLHPGTKDGFLEEAAFEHSPKCHEDWQMGKGISRGERHTSKLPNRRERFIRVTDICRLWLELSLGVGGPP